MQENPISKSFEEALFQISEENIQNLSTIVVWRFRSKTNPSEERFFIKNNLFSSNWREKIRGMLLEFDFLEEQDTGILLQREKNGDLAWESVLALKNMNDELRTKFRRLTGG